MKSLRQKKRKQSFCESELKMPLLPLSDRQPAESRGAAFGPGAGRIAPERSTLKGV